MAEAVGCKPRFASGNPGMRPASLLSSLQLANQRARASAVGCKPRLILGNLSLGYFCEVDGDDTPNIDIDELATATWHHKDAITKGAKDNGISLTREIIRVFSEGQ